MKNRRYQFWSLLLALALAVSLAAAPAAAAPRGLTRQQAAERLVAAAADYNPGVTVEAVMRGDHTGALNPDRTITRAETLLMLERAFGGLPEPKGANARSAYPAETFRDVPAWAADELANVFAAGIVAGDGAGSMAPTQPVTVAELNTLIQRVYALEGSNLKDDFYAAINKDWLEKSAIPAGWTSSGTLSDLSYEVTEQVADLIADIAAQPQTAGTAEAKIAALYETVTDLDGRNARGVAPIQTYLDEIAAADCLEAVLAADAHIYADLGLSTLLGYGLTTDLMDSSRYIVGIAAFGAAMDKDFYQSATAGQRSAYLDYLTALFTLSGLPEESAGSWAALIYEMERTVSAASLDPQDQSDVTRIYNLYTPDQLQALFPAVDMDKLYASSGLAPTDIVWVGDKGALLAAAAYFDEEHLEELKAMAWESLVAAVGGCLSQDFQDASYAFNAAYYGVEGRETTEQIAAQQVQSLLSDYLARAYAEAYFTAEAKADVEDMVADFIDIYKARIQSLDWMSDATKTEALKKLDTMGVKVGYPDHWETCLDNAEIRSPAEGGTFFSNTIAIQKAGLADMLARQGKPVDKSEWVMDAYTVNACYNPTANDITFPAAILQAPMYDVNASREENLGGIGYVIAHEITHAFDNNGAMYDENGNVAVTEQNPYGWWTEGDYTAFLARCQQVVAWYDGQESAPGIGCSGMLTLSENVADLGAARCIVEAARRQSSPDYETLFRAVARSWRSTCSREMQQYLAAADVHAPDKLRVNRVLQTLPEFYEIFGIQPGDGMWTEPESRVSVW